MATYCELELTEEERKIDGYYAVLIPYEINHDFFMKARIFIREGKIPGIPKEDLFSFSDYGKGEKFSGGEIDLLLEKINKFEKYLDKILDFVAIPNYIGNHDNIVKIGYESIKKYNTEMKYWEDCIPYTTFINTGEGYYFNCEKKDIIYILSLIKKLAQKAKELNKSLRFVGE